MISIVFTRLFETKFNTRILVRCQLSLIFSQRKIKMSGKRKSDENLEDLTSGDDLETEDLNQSQNDTLASS